MDWAFGFLWWVVSMTALFFGGIIALFIGFGSAGGIGNAIEGMIEGVAAYVAFWTIAPLILTAIVGIAQAWLLRQYIPIAHWFSATVAGGAIAAALIGGVGLLGDRTLGVDYSQIAAWLGTAIAQWYVLQRYSSRAFAWPLAAIVASAITWFYPIAALPPSLQSIVLYGIVTAILIMLIFSGRSSVGRA
ncbi:hypothetical protein [Trichocoleus sp. FACHB-262]|uniref:hypothetical protein n=1 Tax=Trichocoleus sp. FACHB-262 TaxID=2692869 RepID=UPI001684B6D0|nr:hypothetical protein [Trichocoleus sp. FACHB-262]MBD2124557.1 hypothetical protein [Trichocoleus sp. FACHB-262]